MKRRRGLSPPAPPRTAKKQKKKPTGKADKNWFDDIMLLLFETPSGFALFHCCAFLIEGPNAVKMEELCHHFAKNSDAHCLVWLKQFRTFEDKSSAINQNTGVNERLSEMIMKCYRNCPRGMKLTVAKAEYKKIIEERLNIPCVHGPIVMELMWGLQNCMRSLVPREKSQLTKEDLLPVSQGLQTVLHRYGCNDVKPEMVNELIVTTASSLFWADSIEKPHYEPLRSVGHLIKAVSGIKYRDWSLLKIATALKAIWWPEENGDSSETISDDDVSRLVMVKDRQKYEVYMDKWACLGASNNMIWAYDVRTTNKKLLELLVQKAKKEYETEHVTRSASEN